MTDPAHPADAIPPGVDPKIAALFPSAQEVFDALMKKFEPDLTSTNIKQLDQKYANETPEEKKERMARYSAAFEQYDKDYKRWIRALQDAIQTQRSIACKHAEKRIRKEQEAEALAKLEASFAEPIQKAPPPPPTPEA